jgi:hypothetical protein
MPWNSGTPYADIVSSAARWDAGWSLVGASRRGRLHAHRGEFREDAFRLAGEPGYFALVAADGAGSCRLSRIGSDFLCASAVARLRQALGTSSQPMSGMAAARLVGKALTDAVADVAGLARDAALDPREFRTTLLAAIWYPSATGETLIASQVGDGFVALRRADGRVERLGAGDSSEFSGEVSCFVPDAGSAERAGTTVVVDGADVTAIALGTDGVEDPFYPIERQGPTLFSQLMHGVTAPAEHFQRQELQGPVFGEDGASQLVRWLGFERRGENDDRTLVAAWR